MRGVISATPNEQVAAISQTLFSRMGDENHIGFRRSVEVALSSSRNLGAQLRIARESGRST